MGASTAGSVAVTVQTSEDTLACAPVSSGNITGKVVGVSFRIEESNRIAGKAAVPITLGFTPISPVPAGGALTITYPPGFFALSDTPVVSAGSSSILGLTGTCGSPTNTYVVISIAGAAIVASAFTITIDGFKLGPATDGAVGVTVQTSSDTLASLAVSSGGIYSQVTFVNFTVAQSDRIAAKLNVPATLSFAPTNAIPPGGNITLIYCFGFFATSAQPTIAASSSNIAGLTGTCSMPTTSNVICTTSGATVTTGQFTVTISGFRMGQIAAASSGIQVQTSSDKVPSVAVACGAVNAPPNPAEFLTNLQVW
jgi:hypothetical protein